MTTNITPLVLTFNEQENIARTLSALSWAKEILILDSGSTDSTIEIAMKAHPNVRVVQRAFDSHTNQWNFGLDQVKTEWVLSLDADYEVSPELRNEIQGLMPANDVAGYAAHFEYRIFGQSLRASVYPPRVVLFRRDRARYVADGHTQLLRLDGARSQRPEVSGQRSQIGKLSGKIYHDDRKPFSRWLQAQDCYAKIEARHLLQIQKEKGESRKGGGGDGGQRTEARGRSGGRIEQLKLQDRLRLKIFFAAPAMFLYLLLGRGLILDGWRGWYYVGQRVIAEFMLSIRLIEARRATITGESTSVR